MLSNKIAKKIGLEKYFKKRDGYSLNLIESLASSKKLCVDVGLSEVAPNAATWLLNDPDRCVIGVEPLDYNWERLEGKHDSGKDDIGDGWPAIRIGEESQNVVVTKNPSLDIRGRFFGIKCAIDNVSIPEEKEFYHMEEAGGSSLLKPNDNHTGDIKKVEKVQCVSLSDILDHVDWRQFGNYIEHLKVDAEGHDLEVLKSAGQYLENTIFVSFEMSNNNEDKWDDQYSWEDAIHYMTNKGFAMLHFDGGNIVWLNRRFDAFLKHNNWHRKMGHYVQDPQGRAALRLNTSLPLIVDPIRGLSYWYDMLHEDGTLGIEFPGEEDK